MPRLAFVFVVLLTGCAASPPPRRSSSPEAQPHRPVTPIPDRACEGATKLSRIQSPFVPEAPIREVMAQVIHAGCACSRSGEALMITATIVPEKGTVSARVDDDEAIDACVASQLRFASFTPFELASDCIDCGPKRFGVFRHEAAPPREDAVRSRVVYPLKLTHP